MRRILALAGFLYLLNEPGAGAATQLVSHGDMWRYFRGTTEPQAGWTNIADASLNAGEWLSGPGGFGYGDSGISGEATSIASMQNNYSTLYIRRAFALASAIDPAASLRLTIDYDDAYIAYLDGVEISRSPNAPARTTHSDTAAGLHEASCCNAPVNAPAVLNLGLAGERLGAGEHIFAIQGFNESIGSSDFHLIADLAAVAPGECAPNTICSPTTWRAADGPIVLTANQTVASGAILTIEAGTEVRLGPGVSLRAESGGAINVTGTAAAPVVFKSNSGTTVWGELAADGANSSLTLMHAEIAGGAVKFRNGATGLMEDCYVHDYKSGSTPIAGCNNAKSVTVRRSRFNVYHETLWQFTPTIIEDSLFENANNPSSDALDFDGAPLGSAIRRCTFRHGPESNTDAIDIGSGSQGTVIEDCLMFNFPNDKGVSIGEDSFNIVIRNCLVIGCDSGVAVKDNCTAIVSNSTFVNNDFGFRNYNKADPGSSTGGGHIIDSFNNILWANGTTISLLNGSTLAADHSNFSATNWVGEGNLSVDPLFLNAAEGDFQLDFNSPCIGTGRGGTIMGARLPVGAAMAASHPSFESVTQTGTEVKLRFWVDNEKTYSVLASNSLDDGWTSISNFDRGTAPREVEVAAGVGAAQRFFKLVTPAQP